MYIPESWNSRMMSNPDRFACAWQTPTSPAQWQDAQSSGSFFQCLCAIYSGCNWNRSWVRRVQRGESIGNKDGQINQRDKRSPGTHRRFGKRGKEWKKRHAQCLTPCNLEWQMGSPTHFEKCKVKTQSEHSARIPSGQEPRWHSTVQTACDVSVVGKAKWKNGEKWSMVMACHGTSWHHVGQQWICLFLTKVGNWFLSGLPTGVVPTQKGNGGLFNIVLQVGSQKQETIIENI